MSQKSYHTFNASTLLGYKKTELQDILRRHYSFTDKQISKLDTNYRLVSAIRSQTEEVVTHAKGAAVDVKSVGETGLSKTIQMSAQLVRHQLDLLRELTGSDKLFTTVFHDFCGDLFVRGRNISVYCTLPSTMLVSVMSDFVTGLMANKQFSFSFAPDSKWAPVDPNAGEKDNKRTAAATGNVVGHVVVSVPSHNERELSVEHLSAELNSYIGECRRSTGSTKPVFVVMIVGAKYMSTFEHLLKQMKAGPIEQRLLLSSESVHSSVVEKTVAFFNTVTS